MPGGGAVAQVRGAAVDADPGQLLLLAVPGCGTAAGQNDAQGSYRGTKEGGRQAVRQGRVMSWCLAQQEKKRAQVSIKYCKCVIRETFGHLKGTHFTAEELASENSTFEVLCN